MKRQLALLCSLVCLGACNSERSNSTTDAGTGADSSTSHDAATVGDASTTEDASVPADAHIANDAGAVDFPAAEYDESGCLSYESASTICQHADDAACDAMVTCGLTDESSCSIDCTMATVLCLSESLVSACLASVNQSCEARSACEGWLYFPSGG